MIAALCDWIYDLAASWWPAGPPSGSEEDSPVAHGSATVSPATAEALRRARAALAAMESFPGSRAAPAAQPLDARFRAARPGLFRETAHDVASLAGRLDRIEVSALTDADREVLLGAATRLVRRLRS